MFQQASRAQLRFNSPKGLLTVEDLWLLPLTSTTGKANLDDIARGLHLELKSDNAVSFVEPTKPANERGQLAFDIVKHIIGVRLAENAKAAEAAVNKAKKQKLLEILDHKQNEALGSLSIEELRAQINAL